MDVVVYLHPNSILNVTKMKTISEKTKQKREENPIPLYCFLQFLFFLKSFLVLNSSNNSAFSFSLNLFIDFLSNQ